MPPTECPTPVLCAREFADIKKDIAEMSGDVKDLKTILTVSNGSPCVVEQLHTHRNEIDAIKERLKEDQKHSGKYTDMAASAFINLLVTALVAFVGAMALWQAGVIGK